MADALIEAIKLKFDEFLERYYHDAINDIAISFPNKKSLYVDVEDLEKYDPELAAELLDKPDVILEGANLSLVERLKGIISGRGELHVRFYNQKLNSPLVQDVGSEYIGKMIMLDSLIVKRSEISPRVKVGTYECSYCGARVTIRIGKDEVSDVCPQCKRKSLKRLQDESEFINLQKIAIQDPLERLRGNTPTWQLEAWIEDDMVNTVIPGDRVDLTGILRIRPRRGIKGKIEPDLYTMFLDTISISKKKKDFADVEINEEEKREIKDLAEDPQIFDKIAKSIVPSIYGHEEIKQAVALQLFGGTEGKQLVDGGLIRSDIHMLLIGDPGSAKTRILQAVSRLVPKGIYVSGKSVTGGGLTAVAERDDFSEGGWTLKAGALVLGSGGVVSIDEFDKIGDEDRAALHEALESQTISVAKAGIIATFTAKSAVLAAANPKYGRFDPNQYPAEQFNIPPTLLSRFDLIFPMMDSLDEELDRSVAKHILVQHQAAGATLMHSNEEVEQVEMPPIDREILRKYISYARRYINPRLGGDAADKIEKYYMELRKFGRKEGAVPITPRQIEGLVRLAEASAKSRLSTVVEEKDAQKAIDLSEFMLKTLAVDRSGRYDIDTILTGMPREKVDRINTMLNIIKKFEEAEGFAKMQAVIVEAEKEGLDSATASKYIGELEKSGDVFAPRPGILKVVKHESE
ncbi:MAG: minichromosome maintenance protein MCM [Candidatus Marsarchaeota archaeon]|nr:minichromosome maintenance protein MCM [Candidatus Marsarchaeota archaeon]